MNESNKHQTNKTWHVFGKHSSLKEEILNGDICYLSKMQWIDILQKSINIFGCNECKIDIAMSTRVNNSYLKLENAHLISILLFCDFDELREHMLKIYQRQALETYAKTDENVKYENNDHWKLRYSSYVHWSKLLYDVIFAFGMQMNGRNKTVSVFNSNLNDNIALSMVDKYYFHFNRKYMFDCNEILICSPILLTSEISVPQILYGEHSDGVTVELAQSQINENYLSCKMYF